MVLFSPLRRRIARRRGRLTRIWAMAVNYKIIVLRQFYIHSYKAILIAALLFSGMLGKAQNPTGDPTGNTPKEAYADPSFSSDCSIQDVLPQQSKAECAIVDAPSPASAIVDTLS